MRQQCRMIAWINFHSSIVNMITVENNKGFDTLNYVVDLIDVQNKRVDKMTG